MTRVRARSGQRPWLATAAAAAVLIIPGDTVVAEIETYAASGEATDRRPVNSLGARRSLTQ